MQTIQLTVSIYSVVDPGEGTEGPHVGSGGRQRRSGFITQPHACGVTLNVVQSSGNSGALSTAASDTNEICLIEAIEIFYRLKMTRPEYLR